MIRKDGKSSGYTADHLKSTSGPTIPTGAAAIDLALLDAAPKQWNFFSPLKDFKKDALKQSILDRGGILNPIVLWEQDSLEGTRYMILSGHNRVEAYRELSSMARENNYEDIAARFNQIPAIIKKRYEIDENEARQIIIDLNWAQRDLTVWEKHKAIITKFALIKENKTTFNMEPGRTREKIAQDFNITGRQIQKYLSLGGLIEEWQSIIDEEEISLTMGLALSKQPESRQKSLFDTHLDDIIVGKKRAEAIVRKIKTNYTNSKIDSMFLEMVQAIEDEKASSMEEYSLKVTFKIDKEQKQALKNLSKEEQVSMAKEIEKLIRKKFLKAER